MRSPDDEASAAGSRGSRLLKGRSRNRRGWGRSGDGHAEASCFFVNLVRVFSAYRWHGAAGHNTFEAGAYLHCADRLTAVSPTGCHAPPKPQQSDFPVAVGTPTLATSPSSGASHVEVWLSTLAAVLIQQHTAFNS